MPSTRELNNEDRLSGFADAAIPAIDGRHLAEQRWYIAVPQALESAHRQGFLCIQLQSKQQATIENALSAAGRFFDLDDIRKAAFRGLVGNSGWTPSREEPAYQPGTESNVESFDVGLELVESQDATWPDVADFSQAIIQGWREYLDIADSILELLARAAGIESTYFVDHCGTRALNTMRLLHYPPESRPWTTSEVGIAAHTDFECITLLYQTSPGLELRDINGHWLEAPSEKGRLIVLLDDMLERWTNGFFQATGHRVRRTAEERYSLVMFIAVDDGIQVAPLPEFVSAEFPQKYEPIGQAQHIDDEMQRARANMS